MKLPSLIFLLRSTGAVIRRFPVVAVSTVVAVVALMTIVEQENRPDMVRLWMMAQLGIPLFVGLSTLAESRNWLERNWRHWALMAAGALLLTLYYTVLPNPLAPNFGETEGVRFTVILLAAHLFVAVAPYLNNLKINDFWEYNKQLFASFIVGAVFTLILWGGLSLAVVALKRLFDINIRDEVYVHLFILLAGLFNTTYFLHHVPRHFALDASETAY
ncbi:MAG TPA: hypothetical protein PLW66_02120, partial [Saprospiraceae bacterium]|nr:hypothetical protein [Saprospiraceae bacterium]